MNPTMSGCEVVKHVPHRLLISQWAMLAPLAARTLLGFNFQAGQLDIASAMVTRVVHHGDETRYLVLHCGTRLAEAAVADSRGKYLDDILPDETRDGTVALFDLCRRSRRPVYAVADGHDDGDHAVHFERLLLPFTDGDSEVSCIITTMLISPDERGGRAGRSSNRRGFVAPIAIYTIATDDAATARATAH